MPRSTRKSLSEELLEMDCELQAKYLSRGQAPKLTLKEKEESIIPDDKLQRKKNLKK